MSSKYNIIYSGLQDNVTAEEFVTRFCKTFGISEAKAKQIAASGSDVTIKKNVSGDKAAKYIKALEACGAIAYLQEQENIPEAGGLSLEPIQGEQQTQQMNQTEPEPAVCPKCGSSNIQSDECLDCGIYISKYQANLGYVSEPDQVETDAKAKTGNIRQDSEQTRQMDSNPYATPQADLIDPDDDSEAEPEKVPAGNATAWLGRSYWHFKQNPFAWIFALVIFIALSMTFALVPFIGVLVVYFFSPVVMAGFSLGAQEQDQGGDFRVGHLFAGFSQNFGTLVMVGVLYLLFIILIVAVFGGIMAVATAGSSTLDLNNQKAIIISMGAIGLILMLLAVMLIIFVAMAYYYAPTLVALDNMSALEAMKMSLKGCLKNWLALLVYSILAFLLLLAGMIPVMLGLLVVIPMLQASVYVSYRDIFHHQD